MGIIGFFTKRLILLEESLQYVRSYGVVALSIAILGISNSFVTPFMSLYGTDALHMGPTVLGMFISVISVSTIIYNS